MPTCGWRLVRLRLIAQNPVAASPPAQHDSQSLNAGAPQGRLSNYPVTLVHSNSGLMPHFR
jgi:hypothetical protein